jgi:hypothetical protein
MALPACSSSPAASPSTESAETAARSTSAEAGPPVELVSAGLHDTVVPRPDGQISWMTTWRACFRPGGDDHEVIAWQARAVTSEGSSSEADELPGGCLDLDVATGVNATEAGMPGREIQLSDAQSLAYRVRAVYADGTVSPWTDPVRVGTETSAG